MVPESHLFTNSANMSLAITRAARAMQSPGLSISPAGIVAGLQYKLCALGMSYQLLHKNRTHVAGLAIRCVF